MEVQSKKLLVTVFIFIVVVLIVVCGLYLFYNGFPDFNMMNSGKPNPVSTSPTLSETMAVLSNKVPFTIPVSKTSTTTNIATFGKELLDFIPSDINIDSVTAEIYSDNTTGYIINYTSSKNLNDSFYEYLNPNINYSFKIIKASVANKAGLISAQSPNFLVEVTLEKVDDSNAKVKIQIQRTSPK